MASLGASIASTCLGQQVMVVVVVVEEVVCMCGRGGGGAPPPPLPTRWLTLSVPEVLGGRGEGGGGGNCV